jgi:hypothetical protein
MLGTHLHECAVSVPVQHPEQAPGWLANGAGCKQATAEARVADRAYGHIHFTLHKQQHV